MSIEESTRGFRQITVSGDADGNVLTDIEMAAPRSRKSLGTPPERNRNGRCSHCDRMFMAHYRYGWPLEARDFHRVDGRLWADETEEAQR